MSRIGTLSLGLGVIESVLLLQEAVLDKLMDQGEDNRMGCCLNGGGLSRGEGEENPGSEKEEENCRCQKIPHVFACRVRKSSYWVSGNCIRQGPSVRRFPGHRLRSMGAGRVVDHWGNDPASNPSLEKLEDAPPMAPGLHLSCPERHPTPGQYT